MSRNPNFRIKLYHFPKFLFSLSQSKCQFIFFSASLPSSLPIHLSTLFRIQFVYALRNVLVFFYLFFPADHRTFNKLPFSIILLIAQRSQLIINSYWSEEFQNKINLLFDLPKWCLFLWFQQHSILIIRSFFMFEYRISEIVFIYWR